MEFKSQICTRREQSEALLALGLKPETADMTHHHKESRSHILEWELVPHAPTLRGKFWTPERIAKLSSPFHKHPDGTPMTGEEIFDRLWGKDIPAWSLARLLEMMPQSLDNEENVILMVEPPLVLYYDTLHKGMQHFTTYPDIFDNCVSMIGHLIRAGAFNKKYLK